MKTFLVLFLLLFIPLEGYGQEASFVRRNGRDLIVGKSDEVIYLRGVNMSYDRVSESFCGGGEWRVADHTDWGKPVTCWYQEKHFQLLKEAGFNTARINLSYRIFEDNENPGRLKPQGFALIDQLVEWGRRHDIYLILDMHVAPGGAGIIACRGCGYRTWDEEPNQDRLKALWKNIARRYADEPQIAAYDLLNEPAPTRNAAQWKDLAQSIVDDIRSVDQNHLIIVEMPNWIFDRNDRSPLENFDSAVLKKFQFLINDPNILYDFHYYFPTAYTLQDETGAAGGRYPDQAMDEQTINGKGMPRGKNFLRAQMEIVNAFWVENNVPANIGEWGVAESAIVNKQEKGGLLYVEDMLDVMEEQQLHWQFYFIHKLFKIDCCYDDNPTQPMDDELINIFQERRK